jgi:hypothetical protein
MRTHNLYARQRVIAKVPERLLIQPFQPASGIGVGSDSRAPKFLHVIFPAGYPRRSSGLIGIFPPPPDHRH